MRFCRVVLLTVLALAIPPLFQSQSSDRATIIAFAQKAALQSVNFRQGDIASLARTRADFTPEGWKDFMKHMEGFLDANGAPTFTSSFVPSKDAVFLDSKNGVVHFRIPGTLTQTSAASRTTYRAALEVYALRDLLTHGGGSIKIQRLEQITCVGGSTACQ